MGLRGGPTNLRVLSLMERGPLTADERETGRALGSELESHLCEGLHGFGANPHFVSLHLSRAPSPRSSPSFVHPPCPSLALSSSRELPAVVSVALRVRVQGVGAAAAAVWPELLPRRSSAAVSAPVGAARHPRSTLDSVSVVHQR